MKSMSRAALAAAGTLFLTGSVPSITAHGGPGSVLSETKQSGHETVQHPTLSGDPDLIPMAAAMGEDQSAASRFGYDPEEGSRHYGRPLKWINFDPALFPKTASGDLAREALGHFLTHVTSDTSFPLWVSLLPTDDQPKNFASEVTKDIAANGGSSGVRRLMERGVLPSPYRYQLDLHFTVELDYGFLWLSRPRPVEAVIERSLSESTYARGTTASGAPRLFSSGNCLQCHGGVYLDRVIGGAPNNRFNPELAWRQGDKIHARLAIGLGNISESLFRFFLPKEVDLKSPVGVTISTKTNDDSGLAEAMTGHLYIDEADGRHLLNTLAYLYGVPRKIMNAKSNETSLAIPSSLLPYANNVLLKADGDTLDSWVSPSEWSNEDSAFGKMLKDLTLPGHTEATSTMITPRPWWLARYSGNHFWFGLTPHGPEVSAGDLAMFLATPTHGNDHTPPMEVRRRISLSLQTYMDEIEAPEFPGDINWDKARLGYAIYADNCGGCHGRFVPEGDTKAMDMAIKLFAQGGEEHHGTWSKESIAPLLSRDTHLVLVYDQQRAKVPFSKVKTDRRYWNASVAARPGVDNVITNPEAQKFRIQYFGPRPDDIPFIFAPPLVSLWASSPYLHNGSVPTVYHVLTPDERPRIWKASNDPHALDMTLLGLPFEEVRSPPRPTSERESSEEWRTYDTNRADIGMSGEGHPFGSRLSREEKMEVIEFLKMIDSNHVAPHVLNARPARTYYPKRGEPVEDR